jgi:hypothetical protein
MSQLSKSVKTVRRIRILHRWQCPETIDLRVTLCYNKNRPDKQEGLVAAVSAGRGSVDALAVNVKVS